MTQDTAGEHDDPIMPIVDGIVAQLRDWAEKPDATLTCADLIRLIGPGAHVVALMVFALLNLLPGPPGYNFLIALAMVALSVAMLMRRPIELGKWSERIRLPIKIIQKLLDVLALIVRWAARVSQPRWRALTSDGAHPFIAVLSIGLSVLNMLPIPFANFLPSVGIAVICMGVLNRDGVAVLVGAVVGLVGAMLTLVAVWILIVVVFALGDIVEHAIDPDVPPAQA